MSPVLAQGSLRRNADNRPPGTGQTDIRQVQRPSGKSFQIMCLNMGMRPVNKMDPPIQMKAHGALFPAGFPMKVDHRDIWPDIRTFPKRQDPVRRMKRTIGRCHEDPSDQIDHTQCLPSGQDINGRTRSRAFGRIIQGTQDTIVFLEKRENIFLIEQMIPRGNGRHPQLETLRRGFLVQTFSPRQIFSIHDNAIKRKLCLQTFDPPRESFSTGFAEYVADKKNPDRPRKGTLIIGRIQQSCSP